MSDSEYPHRQSVRIYTGPGSSNSWVWLADFLEANRFLNVEFCTEPENISTLSVGNIAVIPGGDTFEIAEAFGEEGLSRLGEAVRRGGNYIGICAGAYLPLRSSVPPLSDFNLLSTKIANISSKVPNDIEDEERFSVRYGCSFIYHPVRGAVRLSGIGNIVAPIYGGPMLVPAENEKELLRFEGLTEVSECLVNRLSFERTVIGKAACVEGKHGKGRVVVISPHLEHPDYKEANSCLVKLLCSFRPTEVSDCTPEEGAGADDMRKVVADLRVLASSLDSRSWKIGIKYWESDKLLFFIETIRRRLNERRGKDDQYGVPGEACSALENARSQLRSLMDNDDERALQTAIDSLSKGASIFLNAHFTHLRQSASRQVRR